MHAHRKAKRRRLLLFRGEVEKIHGAKMKAKRRNFSSSRYFVFSPRNNQKDEVYRHLVAKSKRRKRRNFASFRLFRLRPEITKRRRLSSFRGEKTIDCGLKDDK